MAAAARRYCVELVRRHDFPGYLSCLWFGGAAWQRSAAFAIRAFNVETALVLDAVRGNAPAAGLRMQWWRDAVQSAFRYLPADKNGEVEVDQHRSHAVVQMLADCVERQRKERSVGSDGDADGEEDAGVLSKRWFDRVIDARFALCERPVFDTLDHMEMFAEETHSSVLYLLMESRGVFRSGNTDRIASHVGVASGLALLLRGAIPLLVSQQECVFPVDLLRQHGLSDKILLDDLAATAAAAAAAAETESAATASPDTAHTRRAPLEPPSTRVRESLRDIVYEVAAQAYVHAQRAHTLLLEDVVDSGLRRTLVACFLQSAATSHYLHRLQACDFDLYDAALWDPRERLKIHVSMLGARIMGRLPALPQHGSTEQPVASAQPVAAEATTASSSSTLQPPQTPPRGA